MQKVAWPRTIVQNEKGISIRLNAERSEMPVMMPGSAIGRMTSSEIVSRPKNFVPDTAAAQSVPRTSAIAVEIAATCTESVSACQTSGRFQVTAEPFERQPRRRPLVGLLLGREGIEEDQRDRQEQEEQPGRRRRASGRMARIGRGQSASNAPMRLATQR